MPVPECRLLMKRAEELFLDDPSFGDEMRSVLRDGGDAAAIVEVFAGRLPAPAAATLKSELSELPPLVWKVMAEAWLLAERAGARFRLVSAEPEEVTTAARRHRIDCGLRIEHDQVIVTLAHLPGRHPAAFAPEALAELV